MSAMKKTLLFLLVCFSAAGWWQRDAIDTFVKDNLSFSWLTFEDKDYAAVRFNYMATSDDILKIAIIPPAADVGALASDFFQDLVKGAELARDSLVGQGLSNRRIDLVVDKVVPLNEQVSERVYELGSDKSVFAVILPFTPGFPRQSAKVIGEYLGLLVFHPTPSFSRSEVNSYLSFENTYPAELFGRALAEYARKRNLQSLLMVTERTNMSSGYAHSQDFWFSKYNIPVTSSFFYENNMIVDPMFGELHKKMEIFNTDSIYWGSLLNQNKTAIEVTTRYLSSLETHPESLMFLPVSFNAGPLLKPYLANIEKSSIDPIIAYPVLEESDQKRIFDKSFQTRYNRQPSHAAYYGYDSIMLLANAVHTVTDVTPKSIASFLRQLPYRGIITTYKFDSEGKLVMDSPVQLGRIKKGELIEIDSSSIEPLPDRREYTLGADDIVYPE